jgi:hypothetical protein
MQWRIANGVSTYYAPNVTTGQPWAAFYSRPASDPQKRSFERLVEIYSMAACSRRGLVATGRSRDEACQALATRNGVAWPV